MDYFSRIEPSTREKWLMVAALLLLAPALLINLGMMTFIDDEAIRSLVALEMDLSGQYIAPTLAGEWYYNKPPLYNWILLVFFKIGGHFNEFTARLVTVTALLGYAGTVFYFFRKHYSVKTAFLHSFFLITCGRILFWDSLLGLIDIAFSWCVFTGFMLTYHLFAKQKWLLLFLSTYLLTTVGYLMKGLPALVFQALTLLAYFIYKKEFKRLLSWQHFLGIGLLALLLSTYYFAYAQVNDLQEVLPTLLNESSKRTAAQYGIGQTLLHLLTFPFEMVYHFLPWSVFIVLFFRRGLYRHLQKDPFVVYCLLVFLVNIILYWMSVEVYPRYLLMHAPLLFAGFIYLYQTAPPVWKKGLDGFLLVFCCMFLGLSIAPLFLERTAHLTYRFPVSLALFGSMLFLLWLFGKWKEQRLLIVILVLLLARIGFNLFVLPDRLQNDWGTLVRQSTRDAAALLPPGETAIIYRQTALQTTNLFYFSEENRHLIRWKSEDIQPGDYLIIDSEKYPEVRIDTIAPIAVRFNNKQILLGRFRSINPD